MGRIAVTLALCFALGACSSPLAAEPLLVPDAAPGGTSGSSAAEQGVPPRAGAEVAPRAVSAVQRGFPFAQPQPEWVPATPWNYERGRYGERVEYIVIHYTAISYERTLRAFTSPASRVSAHYVVRQDGHLTSMVSEGDTAWQAGNYWVNLRSIGIELELGLEDGTSRTYTDAQYYTTAALACGIAARHGIPLDRQHVIGHSEIPGTGKIDPGPMWDWPHFMYLASLCAPASPVGLKAGLVAQSDWPKLGIGEQGTYTLTLRNEGRVAWRKGDTTEVRIALTHTTRDQTYVGNGWPLPDRPAVQEEAIVPPGGTATFKIPLRGGAPGDYVLRLRPVVDGVAWLPDLGLYTVVQVTAPVPPTPTEVARP